MSIQDFISSEEIPALMGKHDVYVLPSNAYEGWDAVINEVMSVGYAVISSDKVGAGAALIEHDVINGLLFKLRSVDSLYECLSELMCDIELINKLGLCAESTVRNYWEPNIVAHRFIEVSSSLFSEKKVVFYNKGPLSRFD